LQTWFPDIFTNIAALIDKAFDQQLNLFDDKTIA